MTTHSLYIHIPFCKNICTYCDFPKIYYKEDVVDTYLKVLKEELDTIPKDLKTIYIGGGTPTSLNKNQLEYLLKILEPYTQSIEEYTIECNPDIDDTTIELLSKYHINRLSIGVQTFQEELLVYLSRKHTYQSVVDIINKAKKMGIENISIDMMTGIPMQTKQLLEDDLKLIKTLPITHISYYSLILEPHTLLYNQKYKPIDEDLDDEYTHIIINTLQDYGYHRYEVSNYALDGYESIHNKTYWYYNNYYGIGAGSTSKIDHKLITHTRDVYQYIKHKEPYIQTLSKEDTMFNHLMMSLRLIEGLDIDDFFNRYHKSIFDVYPEGLHKHLHKTLIIENNHLKTNNSIDILNNILIDFL